MSARWVAAFVLALTASAALAQWQPARTLKLIVPFAPGGQPDVGGGALGGNCDRIETPISI
jgi:tripartite-type tricarboxylate transporter receptor subunit TctC